MEELWKQYKDMNYLISNHGRVKRFNSKTGDYVFIKDYLNTNGYPIVRIGKYGESGSKLRPIHQLVCEMFIPNTDGKPHINHKDGVKTNNHVGNLEWCTPKENVHHAIKMGLTKYVSGEMNKNRKLKDKDIYEMQKMYLEGYTSDFIAELYEVSDSMHYITATGNSRYVSDLTEKCKAETRNRIASSTPRFTFDEVVSIRKRYLEIGERIDDLSKEFNCQLKPIIFSYSGSYKNCTELLDECLLKRDAEKAVRLKELRSKIKPVKIFPWKLTKAEKEYLDTVAKAKLKELGIEPYALSKYLNLVAFGDVKGLP